uniref:Rieske domain-containing protein n=1 Tax=Panagrolaimus davidi TaxID=227884 RepID=A0A914QBU5_9BILA
MKEVTLSILSADNVETINYRILVIKEKDKWYALAPDCTYCNTPLVKGIVSHGKVRCSLHGTAFNLKTGKLEDLPGFDSLPAFKVTLSLTDVFLSTSLTKISQTRIIDPMSKCKDSINDPVVIVGAGIAGITCAETLRHESYNGRIVIISREDHLPYNRSLLSKNLDLLEDDVIFRDKKFFELHDIELLLGHRVKTINVEDKILTMDDEKKITFKYLVIATGGINKPSTIKGADLDGVYSLRDISDHAIIQECSVKKHVTIVGSGFIALEVASAIGKRARSITVLGKSETPFKIFGSTFGRHIRAFIQDHTRITIRQDSLVRSFEGFDHVEHMVLKDGLCAVAQTVIIANGIHPCTSMLVGSGIQTNTMGYVIVDEQMKTNQSNVFAIGDCTEFSLTLFGGHRISLPHAHAAQFQGKIAALSITNRTNSFEYVPFIWTDLFDRHITFCGDFFTTPMANVETIVKGDIFENTYCCYILKNDEVIAVIDCSKKAVAVQFIEIFRLKIKVKQEMIESNPNDDWKWLLE